MKIAFVDFIIDPARPGASGLSDIVWNMASQLAALGDEVHIVAPYTTDEYPCAGVQVHRFSLPPIGYRNIFGHLLIVLRLWWELRKIKRINIIHAPEYFSTGVLSLLIKDIPIVLTVPGNIYERIKNGNPFDAITTAAYKITAILSAKKCATIIAYSRDQWYWWSYTGAKEERMALIPLGVDTHLFKRTAQNSCSSKNDQKFVILYIGRLSKEKGLVHLFHAVDALKKDGVDLELRLIGDGPQKESLTRLARTLGLEKYITWMGWIPQTELPDHYRSASICVLPSLSEPFGRTMIEAMACQTAFLGAQVGGIADHITDGENGFLVPPGDTKALELKLRFILENQNAAVEAASRGFDYVRQNLDWVVITRRVREEVYRPLVETRSV